ncbi:MAG TPA: response regulator [Leptolyngbyaceae cyanobacterium M33_DOE_097]|uniref:histidine kinase n=1 Tax=Oscillatoriales cyanobacterium SpSt-418 TaxID=2282169 RepID=A0A7C3PP59_9CYAN|nr:response regulator [Leptolyngbyaceae cyanobacterium M33_DOE_097]
MSKPVIICVDDEPTVLESLKIELKRILNGSCLIETAEGGEAALELIGELQEEEYEVALVLADYIMPDIKGDELLRQIHARSPHTLSIMISGQADLDGVSNAIRAARLFRYIPKPWQPDDLRSSVLEAVQSFLQDRKLDLQAKQLRQLYRQVQEFNVELEQQVEERTAKLGRILEFEAMHRRITNKMRESLDESQILQTVVQELATELELNYCVLTLYNLERQTAEVGYECIRTQLPLARRTVIQIDPNSNLYSQILQGKSLHCCILPLSSDLYTELDRELTVFICPLRDEQKTLGDIWLFKPCSQVFDDLEIQTIEQLADQCVITLRQSRLYQLSLKQVQELERLSLVKDEFLSSISHELRSPMATIQTAIQMLDIVLQSPQISSSELQTALRYLQILKQEAHRETCLINDLLDMARLEAGAAPLNITTINLALWLSIITEPFVERTRNQQQHLIVETSTDLADLTTDPSYLERALSELLHNACKYTPIGKTIQLGVQMNGTSFQISVKNFGVEIPATEQSRIFDKFYRITKLDQRKQGGTGLGLALVKKQIERLQGTIQVNSEPGWTMFTIQIPDLSQMV